MDMDMRFKDTYLGMEDEIVWGIICIPANQTYGFQTLANCLRWVTNIITITETMALSRVGCPVLKRNIELLKCPHLRYIIMGWTALRRTRINIGKTTGIIVDLVKTMVCQD
jgi:hypothetical protein